MIAFLGLDWYQWVLVALLGAVVAAWYVKKRSAE